MNLSYMTANINTVIWSCRGGWVNSSTHPGCCHLLSFHKECSSNAFHTSEAKTAISQKDLCDDGCSVNVKSSGHFACRKKKTSTGKLQLPSCKRRISPPPSSPPRTCFRHGSLHLQLWWLAKEEEQTCWKLQLSCRYNLREKQVHQSHPTQTLQTARKRLFPRLSLSRYGWDY